MSQPVELATIVRELGDDYRTNHRLTRGQSRALRAIELCRTAALGGHCDRCDKCGFEHLVYHSCRNRHCPKCQWKTSQQWMEDRARELLPVPYFHVVFTVPSELREIAMRAHRAFYGILFRAVSQTLMTIAVDPRHLGATIGFIAVLHTWTQTLTFHPHIHCIVPAGGFSADGKRWIPNRRKRFLFSVHVLSALFRGRMLALLRDAIRNGEIAPPANWRVLLDKAAWKRWVVYTKRPFTGPEPVLRYLSLYTHRIAISDRRIVRFEDGRVTFRWKDRNHGNRPRLMTLGAEEFLRRYLLHVLPDRFVRIRHYGFLGNRVKDHSIERARTLLGAPSRIDPASISPEEEPDDTAPLCPKCHRGRMVFVRLIESGFAEPPGIDSS
jgi:hypothetical protein